MPDQARPDHLCGVLVVNKPRGMISKDVSRWLQKFIGKKHRLGHVGTLDPEAEGVLPLLLGKATRLQDSLLSLPKTYVCDVELGYETTTLDIEGEVIARAPVEGVTLDGLNKAAQELTGIQTQQAPLYSAVKFQGKPLYSWAREGREDEIDWEKVSRSVEVYRLKILGFENGVVRFEARCGKGTYIRVLAKDLAGKLGTLGTVTRLVRTEASGVTQDQAFTPEEIEAHLSAMGTLREPVLTPIEMVQTGLPELRVSEDHHIRQLMNGLKLTFGENGFAQDSALYNNGDSTLPDESECLLTNSSGRAFGLGSVKRHGAGNMQVSLKRSLL